MGRRASDLNPASGPEAEFAFELRKLLQDAGNPSYRELAKLARHKGIENCSQPSISNACSGKKMPSPEVTRSLVRVVLHYAEVNRFRVNNRDLLRWDADEAIKQMLDLRGRLLEQTSDSGVEQITGPEVEEEVTGTEVDPAARKRGFGFTKARFVTVAVGLIAVGVTAAVVFVARTPSAEESATGAPTSSAPFEQAALEKDPLGLPGRCSKPDKSSPVIHIRSCLQLDETYISFMAKLTNVSTHQVDVVVDLMWARAGQGGWAVCPGRNAPWTLTIPAGESLYTEHEWCRVERVDTNATYQSTVRIAFPDDGEWLAGLHSPSLHVYAGESADRAQFMCNRTLRC